MLLGDCVLCEDVLFMKVKRSNFIMDVMIVDELLVLVNEVCLKGRGRMLHVVEWVLREYMLLTSKTR